MQTPRPLLRHSRNKHSRLRCRRSRYLALRRPTRSVSAGISTRSRWIPMPGRSSHFRRTRSRIHISTPRTTIIPTSSQKSTDPATMIGSRSVNGQPRRKATIRQAILRLTIVRAAGIRKQTNDNYRAGARGLRATKAAADEDKLTSQYHARITKKGACKLKAS